MSDVYAVSELSQANYIAGTTDNRETKLKPSVKAARKRAVKKSTASSRRANGGR